MDVLVLGVEDKHLNFLNFNFLTRPESKLLSSVCVVGGPTARKVLLFLNPYPMPLDFGLELHAKTLCR